MMKNNSLKFLAQELGKRGIASIRKRGVAVSFMIEIKEDELLFEDFISDAQQWVELLRKDKCFNRVIVIGHSEGSLIGMNLLNIDEFISLAGAGQSADLMLKEQLSSQPIIVKEMCFPIIEKLKNGEQVDNVNPMLKTLFRKSIQPYMISWFKYNPQEDIRKLNIPVLILQGTTDIQISVKDADLLSDSYKTSKKGVIEGMNHVLKKVGLNKEENIATYNNPDLPISDELVNVIIHFLSVK
ncbi:alpha/beta hydrolase [Flavobacterium oreochromis]|uniref:Alpha/beta hydrolase n=1 Tax=Flavobacterium oreochromis TaxID=2906078 RepID=A0ABW8P4R7_9FLAO|nr:alpha/beta hydrolase [Flavobacterium oreochromis]